jgi:NADH:ubiquinone oxidoreductase subunit 4 (subunit M)
MQGGLLLAALFLPLFPLSMVFMLLLRRLSNVWIAATLILLWPQLGVLLAGQASTTLPAWVSLWALGTALLYAFRSLALRDARLWMGYMSVSVGALLWLVKAAAIDMPLDIVAFGFSAPLALMMLMSGEYERRFDTVYAGTQGGVAINQPRLAASMVVIMLAVTATPVFPGFFALLSTALAQMTVSPLQAGGLLIVWLIWSWSGMRLLVGLVMGQGDHSDSGKRDLTPGVTLIYAVLLIALALLGLNMGEW